MNFRRLSLVCPILVAVGAYSAIAEEVAAPAPVKAPAHVAQAKTKPAAPAAGAAKSSKLAVKPGPKGVPAAAADSMSNIKFSDPSAPLAATPDAKGALAEPDGGPSFGLKWHATNDPVDPYDTVRHTSGPEGPGAGVEAGVKIPFFGF